MKMNFEWWIWKYLIYRIVYVRLGLGKMNNINQFDFSFNN